MYAVLSESGERPVNEDAIAVYEGINGKMFVLCDGLGGHGGGEIASSLAVQAVGEAFASMPLPGEILLERCIARAQEALLQQQRKSGRANEYKTTIVLLLLQEGKVQWAHVGDSRLYLIQRNKMVMHTLDHSVPQMLVSQGEIKEQDIRFHEDRNRLIRVLGMAGKTPRFAISEACAIEPSMRFLLCSDGFWEWILEKEMLRLLKAAADPSEWVAKMKQTVIQRGQGNNMDNFSAIAVFLS